MSYTKMLKYSYFYKVKIIYSILLLSILTLGAQAQNSAIEYREVLTGQVTENGKSLLSPFSGGMNSTQPNHADLNNDGKNDLTIYDNSSNTLKTFINVGNPGEEKYQYDPKYAKNFPTISYYLKLIDYNCDNVPDLIHKGSAGFSIYTGKYVSNELTFTFYQELYYPGSFGPINAYVQPNDIPIVADLDGDGDLDFASFDVLGSYCPWYKNTQVEDNLPCDSIRIIVGDACYGKMYQTFDRTHILNATCKGGSSSNKKQRHSGNCILSIDVNGDGLLDMMGGNISYNDAQLLFNGGTTTSALFTSQDTMFDADNHELNLHTWPAPFYFDIDNDNDKDLVFTPHLDEKATANYNAMAVYENTGTTAVPNFKWRNDSALVRDIVDNGRNSHPTLYDYDKDGKLDLFLGGEGYYNTATDTRHSQLVYYKNTSVIGTVSFELVTRDFLNLSAKNYDGIYPAFGDVTGDGVDDLVLGNDSGYLAVYNNTATSNSASPNFVFQTDSLAGVDVGNHSFPVIYDMNNDGKTDLLIGCETGTLWLFQDTSLTSTKQFKRIDSAISNIKTGSIFSYFSYGVPFIGPADTTGKDYLFVGTTDGTIERYDGFMNQHTNWVELDSNMSEIQTAYRAAPAVGDLDGDLKPEILIGNQNGGLRLFKFYSMPTSTNDIKNSIAIQLFPNPVKNELSIKAPSNIQTINSYRIVDISGRTIIQNKRAMNVNEKISTVSLNSGLYFIELSFEGNLRAMAKFMKKE